MPGLLHRSKAQGRLRDDRSVSFAHLFPSHVSFADHTARFTTVQAIVLVGQALAGNFQAMSPVWRAVSDASYKC
jgi:hypothetical protein